MAVANRSFTRAATRWTAEQGIRQFLDVGTGIPTEPHPHQVAQSRAPEERVVHADNDPIGLRHAEALLHSTREGVTEHEQADTRQSESILEAAGAVPDFDRPLTLSPIALTHFISDEQGAHDFVRGLVEPLAPGSYLVPTQGTADFNPRKAADALDLYRKSGITMALRHRDGVERLFEGLETVGPGVAPSARGSPGTRSASPRRTAGRSPAGAAPQPGGNHPQEQPGGVRGPVAARRPGPPGAVARPRCRLPGVSRRRAGPQPSSARARTREAGAAAEAPHRMWFHTVHSAR